MQKASSSTGLTLGIILVLLLSIYFVFHNSKIDYLTETAEIVSCNSFEENFLQSIGFKDKNDCKLLNLELHEAYVDDCLKILKTTGNTEYDLALLNSCVYHSFAKTRTSLNAEYYIFKHKK